MYGKVFESMYDGTLASNGPWQALVTFQQMIVLADRDGVVDMTADAIARRTSIPLEIIETGISALLLPDRGSRTPDEDGKRIVLLEEHRDWGWQIVNHAKYQALRSAEERRSYLRDKQAERRAKMKAASTLVNTRQHCQPQSTPTDTDIDIDIEEEKKASRKRSPFDASRIALPDWLPGDLWESWCKDRVARKKPISEAGAQSQLRKLAQLMAEGHTPRDVIENSISGGYQGLFPPAKPKRASQNAWEGAK